MTTLTLGTRVRLTAGTRVGLDSGERFEWGGTKYDWNIVGEPDADEHTTLEFIITGVGASHATLNGGGRDYALECYPTGDPDLWRKATVRTTMNRPEAATFMSA